MAEYTRNIGDSIRITLDTQLVPGDGSRYMCRMAITAVYDYMESDPILTFTHNVPGNNFLRATTTIAVDTDTIDKRITGFNVYVANQPEGVISLPDWVNDWSRYFLKETFEATGDWVASTGTYNRSQTVEIDCKADENQINLLDALGHAPSLNRERVLPRYIVQSRRSQGSIVVMDADDQTLVLSTYSGFGVHEDENFPNLSTDNLGNPQTVRLNARGTLMGIEILNEQIIAFKRAELELYDLQSGVTRLVDADCIAKKSILRTPYGVVWAGRSAIYFMPIDGSGIMILNPNWKNWYDGTYDGTPIAGTDIIAGYDPIEQSVWFSKSNKVYRFSFNYNVWNVREFNDT